MCGLKVEHLYDTREICWIVDLKIWKWGAFIFGNLERCNFVLCYFYGIMDEFLMLLKYDYF